MMMIKGTITVAGTGGGTITNHLFPADRCSWVQVDNTDRGYSVSDVRFYPGANANLFDHTDSTGGQTAYEITGASLGFIGKTGRFVAISN